MISKRAILFSYTCVFTLYDIDRFTKYFHEFCQYILLSFENSKKNLIGPIRYLFLIFSFENQNKYCVIFVGKIGKNIWLLDQSKVFRENAGG